MRDGVRHAGAIMMAVGMVLSSALLAMGANRPFWTEQAMFRFGEDLFFVGRSTCAPTAEVGRQRAYHAAIQEVQNYTRAAEVGNVRIETQMIYEEPNPESCREGQTSVWRLLRAPAHRLDKLNRIALQQSDPQEMKRIGTGFYQKVRDLTPKVGMHKDEVFELFGQPKSITMLQAGTVIRWEYPRFGFTLSFDGNGYVTGWKHAGPVSSAKAGSFSPAASQELSAGVDQPKQIRQSEEPAIDLTKQLEKLQIQNKGLAEAKEARRHCERIYSHDSSLQESCTKYEVSKRERLQASGDIGLDASRAAKVICNSRWPNDDELRQSCQGFERDRILDLQKRRY
ncbi:MAG: hypothetical protein CAF45_000495 [Nitrospira sp. CG24E]|nr:MAG: hypothetical protein CAF45_000495 [Nitrospira sp. CG24E]